MIIKKGIRLIATDLDGTFLNSDSCISDYNNKIFQYLIKNGIEIIFPQEDLLTEQSVIKI